jgi:hypothetical protein
LITRSGSRRSQVALVAAFLFVQTVPALAERDPHTGAPRKPPRKSDVYTPSPITDRFAVEGIFYPFYNRTGLRLDPKNMPGGGTPVSAEHDLGFAAHQYKGRAEAMFRFGQRNKLRVDYEDVNRSATTQLQKNIQFGDQFFAQGQLADTQLAYRILTFSYTYSLYRSDWLEAGIGLAAHLVEAQANGSTLNPVTRAPTGQNVKESAANGFPTIPVDVVWRLTRQISASARAQYFKVSVGNFSGSLLDVHGDVQYRLAPNFSLGVGYTLERINVQLQSSFAGDISIDTSGPEAFFRVSF